MRTIGGTSGIVDLLPKRLTYSTTIESAARAIAGSSCHGMKFL
jgi:hypothetical protein